MKIIRRTETNTLICIDFVQRKWLNVYQISISTCQATFQCTLILTVDYSHILHTPTYIFVGLHKRSYKTREKQTKPLKNIAILNSPKSPCSGAQAVSMFVVRCLLRSPSLLLAWPVLLLYCDSSACISFHDDTNTKAVVLFFSLSYT